jgi:uncharacterized protein (DUF433 family)
MRKNGMSEQQAVASTIVRKPGGLYIAGTRITLYHVMDYLLAGWPPHLIGQWLNVTDQQMADVMTYLREHHTEVVGQYHQVLLQAEENQRYWEDRNRDRLAEIASQPPKPSQEALRARLRELKAQLKN